MHLLLEHLNILENHWAVGAIHEDKRKHAHNIANERLVETALSGQLQFNFAKKTSDNEILERLAVAYEIAAAEGMETLLYPSKKYQSLEMQSQAGAFRSFELRRVLPIPTSSKDRVFHVLHLASLAYVGDRWADLRRWLFDHQESTTIPNIEGYNWDDRILFSVYDGWLRLFRKNSWTDLQGVANNVISLRKEQSEHENNLLNRKDNIDKKTTALKLIALYHWARATEQLSIFMLQGKPTNIRESLDLHFEKAIEIATILGDITFEMLLRWLRVAGNRMTAGSLWSATKGINSRVTKFVQAITSTVHPIIELLPPQRVALSEQGLLDPASRAIVVDLPTSGGKTTLAQFRILQALNQFAQDRGWVAYVAPTRALVAQLLRRLRNDFGSLGIKVEQVSSGIDIDSFEEELLNQEQAFDVLVSTPEKLSLIIRNKKLQHRPLALIVMDEAHNIEDKGRGLRIELLLATIRQDCPHANYLLLMPFVPQHDALARWLDPEAGKSISLGSAAWQPNERIIGLFRLIEKPQIKQKRRKAWGLEFETVSTTPQTIQLQGTHQAGNTNPLDLKINDARSLMNMTAAMAKIFSSRGTSIAIGDSIPNVWKMARIVAENLEPPQQVSSEVQLVQSFLKTEIGEEFELISLLEKGVSVHHAGLPEEVRSLIEWLAEEGHLRVLCATTTITQGINFPVSSLFLSRIEHPNQHGPIQMTPREFWNLAGRAGRINQDSVGVVGLATNSDGKSTTLREFVGRSVEALASCLIGLLDEIVNRSPQEQLEIVINDEQWLDFRSFVAHLLKEANDIRQLQDQTDLLLRNTFGYSMLRSQGDQISVARAKNLLEVTNAYAKHISQNMKNVSLADSTGFDPEGVEKAIAGLHGLENRLTINDWEPQSLFGTGQHLSHLIGVMMKVPSLSRELETLGGEGNSRERIANIAKAWVLGDSLQEIAMAYFRGEDPTKKISEACKGIQRALINNGVWGLAALSKLPGSGIDWENLREEEKNTLNLLPSFLYHGVDTENAVLMRMNQVPRSIAKQLGELMQQRTGHTKRISVGEAREFVKSLQESDWQEARPSKSTLTGSQYKEIWHLLSGERKQ